MVQNRVRRQEIATTIQFSHVRLASFASFPLSQQVRSPDQSPSAKMNVMSWIFCMGTFLVFRCNSEISMRTFLTESSFASAVGSEKKIRFTPIALRDCEQVRMYSRGGHDWSERLPAIVKALLASASNHAVIAGTRQSGGNFPTTLPTGRSIWMELMMKSSRLNRMYVGHCPLRPHDCSVFAL